MHIVHINLIYSLYAKDFKNNLDKLISKKVSEKESVNKTDLAMNNSNENQSNINQAQLNNYKQWFNSHLKKRPGVRLIENLQHDIIDGVALIHLIEIISGNVMPDVNLNPKSMTDYKENIEKVLKFMQNNQVKMQRATAKEILEGNIKSIMRLILALAAHFKPTNLHQTNAANPTSSSQKKTTSCTTLQTQNNKNSINTHRIYTQSANNLQQLQTSNATKNCSKNNVLNQTRTLDSMTHLVQAACVSIADVRRYGSNEKNFNVKYVKRNNLMCPKPERRDLTTTTSNVTDQTYVTQTGHLKINTEYKPVVNLPFSHENSFSNNTMVMLSPSQKPLANSTVLNSTNLISHVYENEKPKDMLFKEPLQPIESIYVNNKNVSQVKASENSKSKNGSLNNETITISVSENNKDTSVNNFIADNVNENLEDVTQVKSMLLKLQNMLMSEDLAENVNEANDNNYYNNNCEIDEEYALSSLSQEEQITILRSKVQQLEIVCGDLRNELNQNNFVSMHQVGEDKGLKTRLNEQDNTILEMKTEQLNMHLSNQQLLQENEALKYEFKKQLNQINDLKFKLLNREELIESMTKSTSGKQKASELHKENVLKEIITNQEKSSNNNDATFTVKRESNTSDQSQSIVNSKTERILKEALYQIRQTTCSNLDPSTVLILKKYEKEIKLLSEKASSHSHPQINPNLVVVGIANNNNNSPKSAESVRSLCESSSASMNSSNSSSVTSSSANSPVMPITNHTPLYNSKNQSSNSSNSSSNITITKYVKTNTTGKDSKTLSEEETNCMSGSQQTGRNRKLKQFPAINDNDINLGHVKKIISQFSIDQKATKNSDGCDKSADNSSRREQALLTSVNTSNGGKESTSTKCFYHLNNENESHCITIFKNVDKISLQDFKEHVVLPYSSKYRYFFKSHEPEFGFLKEEITEDSTILPSFDRNIVAWIEPTN